MGLVSEWLLDNFVKEWEGSVQQANALIQVVTVTITFYFMAFLRLNMDRGTNKYGLVNEGLVKDKGIITRQMHWSKIATVIKLYQEISQIKNGEYD